MNSEERKEYNKKYYDVNRTEIKTKLCQKVTCNLCGRCVIYNNIGKHKLTKLCLKNRKPTPEGITELQYEKLKNEIRDELLKERININSHIL